MRYRWNERTLYTDLPYSGEAHGMGSLTVSGLLQLLRDRNLANFDVCFVQIGEKDMLDITNHQLMHRLVRIIDEFRRHGVRRVVFGSMFLRHDRLYNRRAKRLSKILGKLQRRKFVGSWFKTNQHQRHNNQRRGLSLAGRGTTICIQHC